MPLRIGAIVIKKFLEISTGNVSDELRMWMHDYSDCTFAISAFEIPDYKYIIYSWELDELKAECDSMFGHPVPDELIELLEYAEENGCEIVYIEEQAEDDPNFPVY